MYDARKLQCYTMAHRLQGYADGLDEDTHEALAHMLLKAAKLLEETWDEYNATLPPEKQFKN